MNRPCGFGLGLASTMYATALLLVLLMISLNPCEALYYDGITSYSIYPRLDVQLCANSSFSFDFALSSSSLNEQPSKSKMNGNSNGNSQRLLIYSEQQIEITTNPTLATKKLINSYFLIKLVNGDRLVVNDYWNVNEINIQLPIDYATSWFRFVYTRRLNLVDVNLYKFDTPQSTPNSALNGAGKVAPSFGELTPKMVLVFSKQITHNNYIMDSLSPLLNDNGNTINVELRPKRPGDTSTEIKLLPPNSPPAAAYSHLFVGGIGSLETLPSSSQSSSAESGSNSWQAPFNHQLKHLSKFHGYIMNLQYTSLASQCSVELCSKASISQRQYAIFSLSKQRTLPQRSSSSLLLDSQPSATAAIDDICESDTLTHDICPKDCSCLSNNFIAPYFNCDCSENPSQNLGSSSKLAPRCSQLYKSFAINFDDSNYFGSNNEKFDYPILNSFSKLNVQVSSANYDRQKGVQFRSALSKLTLMPSSEITDSDSCFWDIEDCANGFVQHMIISIDRLDEKRFNQKVTLFVNGQTDSSKLLAYLHKNRLHISLFDSVDSQEWLVSSYTLVKSIHLSRPLKLTLTYARDKYLALHIDGFLIDMCSKPSAPPINHDIYFAVNSLYKSYYEFGLRLVPTNGALGLKDGSTSSSTTIINHQFSIRYLKREYFNDLDGQDSKILVSSPAPSEIIRIDNTQRVMYKIDSPLTGVTVETIELSFKTSQPDGVIFYIRNQPVITYFELINGQPVVVIDTRVKNIYLRPQTAPLNDNKWHDVKLHRDGRTVSINIDSQCHDSNDLEQTTYQILTGGYVYLGLADPNNINLSDKKTFVGEMVRGKVTINNVQQRVVQQPYYWPSMPAITTNQTVNIDTSQLSHDGKMINIIINVYGPPGFNVNAQSKQVATNSEAGDTHFIYLDTLPDTRHISVTPSDQEIDFRVSSTQSSMSRLDSFLIKFQTRQECGQLVTLINDQRNYIGLEIFEGYLFSSSSLNGAHQRFQISRVRVDDGRIYQVHLKQEQQKLLCWLDTDDSYKQSIMYLSQPSIAINTVRVAGQDGTSYGFSSRYGFVGCIGAIIFNERDVIDYKYVPGERRQSCQQVIEEHPAQTPAPTPPPQTYTTPAPPVSLGYISFTSTADILVYNFFYDHEKPCFEDISFIFRTVASEGILFSAHNNDDGHSPLLIGAHIRDGYVYVVYLNATYTQELYVNSTQVNDGNLYRLNIRRNSNGHGFIQLQSYVGVTPLDFYTQPGEIKFSKVIVGGADEWSRIRYFGTRVDFIGCIIDLFQINGNSVIKPADIPKDRYNCNVERRGGYLTSTQSYVTPRPECLPDGYPLSFQSVEDAVTYQHETSLCESIHIPFRTRDSRGIIYSHSSEDGSSYILVFLRRGYVNIVVRDSSGERECEMSEQRVDDGELHKLDLTCESIGYLVATLDGNKQVQNRLELYSPMYLNSYTLGYFNPEKLSSRYSSLDNFRGCLEQVLYNKQCLIYEMLADRNRLTCPVQPIGQPSVTQPPRRPACMNTCPQQSDPSECVVEMDSRGFVVYHAYEAGAQPSGASGRDQIRFSFRVTNLRDQDQDLVSIYHPDRSLRIYLSNGQPMIDLKGLRNSNLGSRGAYNDGKWHRLLLEQKGQELIVHIDDQITTEYIPFEFDLFGAGRLYFGASHGKEANNLHGNLKDIYVKYSNVEYDILASAKDSAIPGVTCEGHVVLKSYVEQGSKLRCVSDPPVDSSNECQTDGVCYASLWRNSSGVVERYLRCFSRDQLEPAGDPSLCRSQDPTRYAIQCCDTDYCNRDIQLKLQDLDAKDQRSVWTFKGPNSGDIEFIPYLPTARQAELSFQFQPKSDGNLVCSRDDNLALRVDLKDRKVVLSVSDAKSRRVLKTTECPLGASRGGESGSNSEEKWYRVSLVKKNRGHITMSCSDSSSQQATLQHDSDIPFVNTKKYGVVFGRDCIDDRTPKRFSGDISQVVYVHDGRSYSFDDLQYSEDARFTYENYVEFRPQFVSQVHSDPKPISFRSSKSSARLEKWDSAKVGRISFEFRVDIANEQGLVFSTESGSSYFAIVVTNEGYLESVLSPHRVPNGDTSVPPSVYYDRFQRLFPHPKTRVNDGNWHKLEFMLLGDSVGSFVLDDDFSSKIRFPINYWNEESAIVFGDNSDIKRETFGSFRGCVRNIVINNRLINWANTGILFNVEAGCYNSRHGVNQLIFLQKPTQSSQSSQEADTTFLQLNSNGCIKYHPREKSESGSESLEFSFKTQSDQAVLFDSPGSEFVIHTQGPSISIRNKDDSISRAVSERGIAFNDGQWHKIRLEKSEQKVDIELDGKYRQELPLTRRSNKLAPFHVGCVRTGDDKPKFKLNELKNFRGRIQNIVYSSSSSGRVDLIDRLNNGDVSVLTEGVVHWTQDNKRGGNQRQQPDRGAVTLRENSFLKLDKVNFDQNSNISFWFKTSENGGLLAFIAPSITSAKQSLSLTTSSFMAVELVNGSASLLIYSSSRERPTRVHCGSPKALNDNKWHRIELKHTKLGDYPVQMSTNPTPTLTFSCDDSSSRVKLAGEPKLASVQFNAGNLSSQMPADLWLAREARFIGCVGGFRVNEREVDLYDQAAPESRQTIERGCAESAGGQCARAGSKCMNQGECVEGYGRTYCNCDAISFTGPKCDQSASTLSFNGSHSIDFTLIEPASSSAEEVTLRFRTRLRNGVLFVLKKSSEEPALTISLEDGRVKCVYDRSKNDKAIFVGDQHQFNNNKWHTVILRRHGPSVYVEVIDAEKQRYSVQDDLGADFGTIRYEQVLVGGIRSVSLLQEYPNFIGWIQNVRLNGEDLLPYHLSGRVSSWAKTIGGNADPGENSLLLHHQITFTSACPITLPRVFSGERFNLHLYFKTSQSDGVILFRRGKEHRFMALELRGGKVRFLLDLGGGTKELVSEQLLNDRNWHEVTIRRFDRQKFAMKIDNFKEQLVDIGTSNPPLGELESFIVGGAVPDFQRYSKQVLSTEGFTGCLASIEINNDAPNLYSSLINTCSTVHQGCADLSCSSESCSHDGECTINGGQVSCNCEMTSYSGPQCKDNSNFFFFGKGNKGCGFIKYAINPVIRNQASDRLAFGFTTTDAEALLVRIEGEQQYMEIRLNGGAIHVHASLAGQEEIFTYRPSVEKRLNDNTYHVLKLTRENNVISLRVDNFDQAKFTLKASPDQCVFKSQTFVYVGAVQTSRESYTYCYYGILTGMFFNGHYVLDYGTQHADVGMVDYRYIVIDIDVKHNRTRPLPTTQICPLGYHKSEQVCEFSICPHYSFQVGDSCSCFEGYYEYLEIEFACVKRNDTPPVPLISPSGKYIPARGRVVEAPIGLILAIISGILLALLAAAIAARKCSDGMCILPPRPAPPVPVATKVHNMFTSTTNTTNESYELNTTARTREEVPLITRQEEFHAKDALDMGYTYYPQPIYNQTVNETMEMYEQTSGGAGGGTIVYTTLTNGGGGTTISQSQHQSSASQQQSSAAHHASARDLAMSSLFFSQNATNSADYELSNVTCMTMTPNGKYAIIGQSIGTPQIWDTLTGQLIRSMTSTTSLPPTNNCNNLTLACNGTLLVGLSTDVGVDTPIQTLQVWDVQTGKQIQMSHQIKCCVFALSQDTNSIFMAGNQRFGRGISVGVFDLVTYELVKEIKSDPTLSLGDTPESIVVTPDERHAIVGCRYQQSGTNFVVFDLAKSSEIAQTKSIALDADPKCLAALSSAEVVTGTRGGHLIQWNLHTCQITLSFSEPPDSHAHLGQINQLALSAEKDYLVSGSSDYTAKVWNVHTKNLVSVLAGHRGEVTCVSVSNNDLVVTGSTDNTVGLWRLNDGCQISSMSVGMTPIEVQMAKHNKTIVAIGEKDGEQQLLMLRVINTQR